MQGFVKIWAWQSLLFLLPTANGHCLGPEANFRKWGRDGLPGSTKEEKAYAEEVALSLH